MDGRAHLSLVAFDFRETRVAGVPWPGFVNFPEINLRFYVRSGDKRGVVFIREHVPQAFVGWLARRLYNEPYASAPMSSRVVQSERALSVAHCMRSAEGENRLRVVASNRPILPAPGSVEHQLIEQQWGFGTSRRGQALIYEVRHPRWHIFPIHSAELSWNWGDAYGPQWQFLSEQQPVSVILAAGSAIEVFAAKTHAVETAAHTASTSPSLNPALESSPMSRTQETP